MRGAKAIVLDADGNVLIVRRSGTHPHVPLTLDLPGGKVEPNESMVDGLRRELTEEVGIDVAAGDCKLIGTNSVDNYYGKKYHIELYEVQLKHQPSITLDFEHDEYSWQPLQTATIVAGLYDEIFESYKRAKA